MDGISHYQLATPVGRCSTYERPVVRDAIRRGSMRLARRSGAWCAVVVAAAVTTAACGSSSNKTKPASESVAKAPSGPSIKLGMMSPVNSTTLSLPEYPKAAQAAVSGINERGGVKGRPLELVHCDDKDDPATAAVCARTLLQDDDVVGLVGVVGRQNGATYPVLDATNKISFGVVLGVPDDYKNPRAYAIMGGSAPAFDIPALVAKDPKVKKVALAVTAASTGQVVIDNTTAALKKFNIAAVPIRIDPKQVDMTPYALQIKDSGAQALIISIAPQSAAPLAAKVTATQPDLKFYMSGWLFNKDGVQAFSDAGVNPVVAMNADLDPNNARFKQYKADMAKFAPDVKNVDFELNLNSWLSVALFAEALDKVPNVTSADVRQFLDKQTAYETGITHPIDFTATPDPDLPRWKNVFIRQGTLSDGKVASAGGDWVTSFGVS